MTSTFARLRILLLAALAVSLVGSRPAAAAPPGFAQEGSDLKPDPAAVWGRLPNGLLYVVMPNQNPRNRASLRIAIGSGSLYEADAQRGLAHFLEHMSFNGSTHYPPGTLVEYFQRLGMGFGGDTNAYTGFDRTVYKIDLPDTKPETMAEGLQVFADYAGGLLLKPQEIDKERGVILAEKRTRDSVAYRTQVAETRFLLGDTLFSKRMPIGLATVIEHARRPEFADFYNAWYRPDNMAFVAVGDFDPTAVVAAIQRIFGPVKARAPERPQPDLGRISAAPGLHVDFHPESEAGQVTVSLETVSPYFPEPDTAANRLKYLPRDLAFRMLNRRLSILAKKENAPFTSGYANAGEAYHFYRSASVDLTCKPEAWRGAVATADQELRRVLQFGFRPTELKEAVAGYANALEQAARRASTRRSDQLAGELVYCLLDDRVFTSPAEDLALYQPALQKVTVEDCLRAFRQAWDTGQRYLFVAGNLDLGGQAKPPKEIIATVYDAAHQVALQPPPAPAADVFAYTHFGPAGTIAHQELVRDLDVHLVQFANGVRLNVKKTDFEANTIRVRIRFGDGRLTEPTTEPGLAFLTDLTFVAGGLRKHSIDDIQRLFAGKTVGLGFEVDNDAFSFSGTTNRRDLDAQLELLAAYFVDPGYRPEALRQARKRIEQMYRQFAHIPSGPMQTEVPRLLAGGDSRFGLPAESVTLARTLREERAWLDPQLARGPVEIAVVGDVDVDATIAAVARTFGALPARVEKPPLTAERTVTIPASLDRTFEVKTEIPKGLITLFWPTTDARDVHVARRLTLLAEILSDRLRVKVREEMGDAYSPHGFSAPSETFTHFGFLGAQTTVDPKQVPPVVAAILAAASDLYTHGATADEIERAKKPILTALRDSARTNGYWLHNVVGSCQEFPQRLDWCRTRYRDFEGISREEINAMAREYLDPARALRVVVLPAPPVT